MSSTPVAEATVVDSKDGNSAPGDPRLVQNVNKNSLDTTHITLECGEFSS
jgi:hypothetical protein